jgi:hypothetical protein
MAILSTAQKYIEDSYLMEGECCVFPRTETTSEEDLRTFALMVERLKGMSAIRPSLVKKYRQPHSIKRPTSMMMKKLIENIAKEV